jgi:hypothetical protein
MDKSIVEYMGSHIGLTDLIVNLQKNMDKR